MKIYNYLSTPFVTTPFRNKLAVDLHKNIKENYKNFLKQEATPETLTQFKERLMNQTVVLNSLDLQMEQDNEARTELFEIIENDILTINGQIEKLTDSSFDLGNEYVKSVIANKEYIERLDLEAVQCSDPYSIKGIMLSKRWRYKLAYHNWYHFADERGSNYASLIQYEYLVTLTDMYACGDITEEERLDRFLKCPEEIAKVWKDVFDKPGKSSVPFLTMDQYNKMSENYPFKSGYKKIITKQQILDVYDEEPVKVSVNV